MNKVTFLLHSTTPNFHYHYYQLLCVCALIYVRAKANVNSSTCTAIYNTTEQSNHEQLINISNCMV